MDQEPDRLTDAERLARIEAALVRLPELDRQIFLARCVYHMDSKEIARQTGLSQRQVWKRLGAAIKALGRNLNKNDAGDA